MYLCYDVRGIQSFIFKIPKLKYIIGGSAVIDRFDRETIKNLTLPQGCERLFTGGGKGTFSCPTKEVAEELRRVILGEATKIGVDIRFGIDEDYDKASKHATDLYPYIPANLSGEYPCNVSGLYPVDFPKAEHPIVKSRLFNREAPRDSEEYKMFRYFEQRLLEKEGLAAELDAANAEKLEFFHNVATTDDRGNYDKDGDIGAKVLGDRNRWAVICMDGNDMGSQMTEKLKSLEGDGEKGVKMSRWVKAMSAAIDRCSTQAAKAGIKAVYDKWAPSDDQQNIEGEKKFVLPLRPLVVGGDDITILCHVNYAMDFVKAACETFEQVSREENDKAVNEIGESIWPATGGRISISAGVLYCPVSLPLHSAIAYTEALLASAKTRGRAVKAENVEKGESEKCPTPASIDWEHITDSVIETPAIYRKRHLYFADPDIGKNVCLTKRPYTLQEFGKVEALVKKYRDKIPTSTRHKVTTALTKSQNDRMAFVASIAKNHKDLAEDLMEPDFEIFGAGKSEWVESSDHKEISTSVVDAMQLLEEEMRMKEGTNND
jgi:hypothetical protein